MITFFPLFEWMQGTDHPNTWSRNKLAMRSLAAGRTAEAISLYKGAFADCKRLLGADHPTTLTTRNNLAMAYRAAGPDGQGDPAA